MSLSVVCWFREREKGVRERTKRRAASRSGRADRSLRPGVNTVYTVIIGYRQALTTVVMLAGDTMDSEEPPKLKDVSHTPPAGEPVRVWERGGERAD